LEYQIGKGVIEMEWQEIVALVVMIPIMMAGPAFVWYINITGKRR